MIDTKFIRDNYSRMPDEQLIYLAQQEGKDLTPEALKALQEEFLHRRLDVSIFETIYENKTAQQEQNILTAQENASNKFINSIWTYALDKKKSGAKNEEIYTGLIQQGLDEQHSLLIIKTLGSKAKEILDAYHTDMLRGGLVCALGVTITICTYASALNGGTYIIAWGAIIFGAIRFLRGLTNTEKYKTIIANIENEHNDDVATEN